MTAKKEKSKETTKPMTMIERGEAAAKLMAKELRAEHKRWNLPLLLWKDGKVVKSWPWKSSR